MKILIDETLVDRMELKYDLGEGLESATSKRPMGSKLRANEWRTL